MENSTLVHQNSKYKYYITKDGKIVRESKNKTIELGYIEDNMSLYKRLCESI